MTGEQCPTDRALGIGVAVSRTRSGVRARKCGSRMQASAGQDRENVALTGSSMRSAR